MARRARAIAEIGCKSPASGEPRSSPVSPMSTAKSKLELKPAEFKNGRNPGVAGADARMLLMVSSDSALATIWLARSSFSLTFDQALYHHAAFESRLGSEGLGHIFR